jgi:hypothetical protein
MFSARRKIGFMVDSRAKEIAAITRNTKQTVNKRTIDGFWVLAAK